MNNFFFGFGTIPIDEYDLSYSSRTEGVRFLHEKLSLHYGSDSGGIHYENDDRVVWFTGLLFDVPLQGLRDILIRLSTMDEKDITSEIRRLNGQFVILCFDKQFEWLRVFRDHLGILPVYYTRDKRQYFFSDKMSELTPYITSCEASFNWLKALSFPEYKEMDDNTSFFTDIFLLPGGHMLEINAQGESKQLPFWSITPSPNAEVRPTKSIDEYVEEYRFLLNDATTIRANNAPETNIFLSGGLDSSAIAVFAQKHTQLKALSILNPLTYQLGDSQRAYEMASNLSIDLLFFVLSYPTLKTTPEEWKLLVSITESPTLDLSHLIKMGIYRKLTTSDVTYSNRYLTGFGSDQFNGGIARTTLNNSGIGYDAKNHWDTYYEFLQKSRFSYALPKRFDYLANFYSFINLDAFEGSVGKQFGNAWHFQMNKQAYLFNKSTVLPEVKIAGYFGQHILFPFLDYRLIDFIGLLPQSVYKELLFDKAILRKVFKDPKKTIAGAMTPKTAIAIDNADNPTFDFYYNLLYHKEDGLAYQALEELKGLKHFFNVSRISSEILGLRNKKERSYTIWLIGFVNAILLYKKFNNRSSLREPEISTPIVLQKKDLIENPDNVEQLLGLANPARNVLHMIVKPAADTMVLKNIASGSYYVSINNTIAFEIEENNTDLIRFLSKDAQWHRTIGEIIDSLNLNKEKITHFTDEAIRVGFFKVQ